MKPLYLRMQAFGSYQQAEIDFTQVQSGLFLVTGDTGSGKTTIFDAITFALFDETSGGKRSGEMMRSQYAKQDIVTEVEFRFLYYDQIYTVIRRPKQEKYKMRMDDNGKVVYEKNKTPFGPDVELRLPDGSSYPGKKLETDKKIREIIGLDANQFTQIAMLAQGDFMKLLQATSKDKMEIFSKIFDTQIYQLIEQELQNRTKESNLELEQNGLEIDYELHQLKLVEDSKWKDLSLEQSQFRASARAWEVTTFIEQLITEAKQKREILQEQTDKDQIAYDLQYKALSDARAFNAIWEKYQDFLLTKRQLDEKKMAMEQLQQKVLLARKADVVKQKETVYLERSQEVMECKQQIQVIQKNIGILEEKKDTQQLIAVQKREQYELESPVLTGNIASIEATYSQYQIYEAAVQQKAVVEKNCNTIQKIWEASETRLVSKMDQKQMQQQKKIELEQHLEHVEVLDGHILRLQDVQQELQHLVEMMEELEIAKRNGQELSNFVEKARQIQQQQEGRYHELYQQFLDSQATILAQNLKEGQPCPVCGSQHHKILAHAAGSVVESNVIRQEQERLDVAAKKLYEAEKKLFEARHTYRTKQDEILKLGKKYYIPDFNLSTVSKQNVVERRDHILQELQNLQVRRKIAEQNQFALKQCIDTLTDLEQSITQEITEQQKNSQELRDEKEKLAGCCATIEMLKSQLQYPTKVEAHKKVKILQQQLQRLKESWTEGERVLQETTQCLLEQKGALQARENILVDLLEKQTVANQIMLLSLQEQGFATIEDCTTAWMPVAELEQAEGILQRYQQQVQENVAQIRTLESETKGKKKHDIQQYQTQLQVLQERMHKNRETATILYTQITDNQRIHQNVTMLYQKREKMLMKNSILKNLDATANGRLNGKHLKFQTYIQRRYFKQIVENANKRLYIMSNGQFLLQCRDTEELASQGFVGLDLNVYSIINDQTRDVKTLSGGESFMAALALALGMADMIQNTTGSVHIDTMFIDEGFGTLSEETRNQAIQILNQLSGGKRLVGIISHVTELKNQIDRKLIVTKSEKGSKAVWEIS